MRKKLTSLALAVALMTNIFSSTVFGMEEMEQGDKQHYNSNVGISQEQNKSKGICKERQIAIDNIEADMDLYIAGKEVPTTTIAPTESATEVVAPVQTETTTVIEEDTTVEEETTTVAEEVSTIEETTTSEIEEDTTLAETESMRTSENSEEKENSVFLVIGLVILIAILTIGMVIYVKMKKSK